MSRTDTVRAMVEPLASEAGASVYDVTESGGKLVVAVTRPGGIDLETLSGISRALGSRLDDVDLFSGTYTLEVTSPGLERMLRVPSHFVDAVGEEVSVRTRTSVDGDRRIRGTLSEADDDGVVVVGDGGTRRIPYTDIDKARTIFSWGPAAKPGKARSRSAGTGTADDESPTTESPSTEQKAPQT